MDEMIIKAEKAHIGKSLLELHESIQNRYKPLRMTIRNIEEDPKDVYDMEDLQMMRLQAYRMEQLMNILESRINKLKEDIEKM